MNRLLRPFLILSFFFYASLTLFANHLSDDLMIVAKLTGNQEVPAVTTDAVGIATFMLNNTRDTLSVNISTSGLSGDITGIHVHQGVAGTNGDVITNLTPFLQGNRIITTLSGDDLTPTMLSSYLSGNYYVNVHTEANPSGEIRGQLNLESDFAFRANLDPMQQTMPVMQDAMGLAYFNLSHNKTTLETVVVVDGLSSDITGIHLHYGAAGVDGGVAIGLTNVLSGNLINTFIDISALPEFIDSLFAGSIYINVHTTSNPSGEIRGQLFLDKDIAFDAILDPSQEVTPSILSIATGAAHWSLNSTFDTLHYDIQTENLTGAITGAHLHDGAFGVEGGVLLNLSDAVVDNRISGMVTGAALTNDIINKMLKGETYINIHTDLNAAGEIRGQLYRVAREAYTYSLESNQEIPATFALAKGSGMASIDRNQSNVHYMMVVDNLSGPLTGAHFHNGVIGTTGGVIYNLTPSFNGTSTNDGAFGYWTGSSDPSFTLTNSLQFREESVYVNIHTAANPAGEVRGQVLRGAVQYAHQDYNNSTVPYNPMFTQNMLFSARLGGGSEVPPVATPAAGVAGFLLNATYDTLTVNINVDDLSGPITGIHIHEGPAGENGGVVFNLTDMVTDKQIQGTITGFDLQAFMAGAYYVNVHTEDNPGGEIRGQIGFETAQAFMADLSGAQEVPAVATDAYGLGVVNVSKDGGSLEVKITATGLSGPITGIHFHQAAMGENGAVVLNLGEYIFDNTIMVTLDAGDYMDALWAGNIYINIHTEANPSGEIRGQLMAVNNFALDAGLNGAQEVPQTNVPGRGVGMMWLSNDWATLHFDIVTDQLSGNITGAHIHQAAIGESGGVLVNLSDFINGNRIMGSLPIDDMEVLNQLILGNTYINVHTEANAGGEIRGQVHRLARDGYTFQVCGGQEVPPTDTDAYGGGILSIDRTHNNMHLMFTTTNLTGPITGAHIHEGAMGETGGVLYGVTDFVVGNSGFTYFPIDPMGAMTIQTGNAYLNVHTEDNPSGEVRGQIDNMMNACPTIQIDFDNGEVPYNPMFTQNMLFSARLGGGSEVPPVATPAAGVAGFLLNATYDTLTVNINVDDLSGPITGIHIHEGPAGENGGVVFNLTDMVTDKQIRGTITGFDLQAFMAGAYYVNVHTEDNPGGEIRGQIGFETAQAFMADLSGAQEVPAVATDAYGLGVVNVSKDGGSLEVKITATGLSGPITGIHFHQAAMGETGGVVENLTSALFDNTVVVTLDAGDYMDALRNGNIYINIHTEANPAGEIRGQLTAVQNFTFDATLNGAQEVPQTNVPGRGVGMMWLSNDWTTLHFDIVTDQLSGNITGAHIHQAAIGESGGVLVNLSDFTNGNRIMGSLPIDDMEVLNQLILGNTYINVHTEANAGGEIRGQVHRLARDGYTFQVCGGQEVPPADTDAYGGGILSIDRTHTNMHLMFTTTNLTGPITGAHIHEGAMGETGGVLYGVTDFVVGNSGFTYFPIDPMGATTIQAGNTYLNVHTEDNPSGEVRGQIDNMMNACPLIDIVGIEQLENAILVEISPNPFAETLYINPILTNANPSEKMMVRLIDMMGKVVYENNFSQTSTNQSITLPNLTTGLYLLEISTSTQRMSLQVMKQ